MPEYTTPTAAETRDLPAYLRAMEQLDQAADADLQRIVAAPYIERRFHLLRLAPACAPLLGQFGSNTEHLLRADACALLVLRDVAAGLMDAELAFDAVAA